MATIPYPIFLISPASLITLRESGVSIERSSLATIAFQAKNYQEAVRLWDETEQVLHKEYKVAKANITKFPDCLALFHDLGDSSEVLRRWTEARPSDSGIRALDPRITHTVIDAALDKNELLLARSLIDVHPERILVGKTACGRSSGKEPRYRIRLRHCS